MKRVCVRHGVRCPTSPPVQITRFQQDTRISAQIRSSKRLIGKVLDLKNLHVRPLTQVRHETGKSAAKSFGID